MTKKLQVTNCSGLTSLDIVVVDDVSVASGILLLSDIVEDTVIGQPTARSVLNN